MALTGHLVALLDVSGPYAGSAMGFVNTVGSLGGIVAPYFVAVLTEIQVRSHSMRDVLFWKGATFMVTSAPILHLCSKTNAPIFYRYTCILYRKKSSRGAYGHDPF